MSTPIDPVDPVEIVGETERDAAVRSVEGVTDVYPARGTLAQLPAIVAATVTKSREPENVVLSADGDGVTITARIGTTADLPATDTARRVADLLLTMASDPGDTVRVQVARVH